MSGAWGAFRQLSETVGLCAFDVGARGGTKLDLEPIASGVDWVCLEVIGTCLQLPDQKLPFVGLSE